MPPGDFRTINGYQIIRTVPGRFTGDMNHQTADGRWWKEVPANIRTTTDATGSERAPIIIH